MRAAASSAARRRARWALGSLVVVNLVMLWFFIGAGASLSWHAHVLDDETLGRCAHSALANTDQSATWGDYRDARFVGDATVTFEVSVRQDADRDRVGPMVLACTLGVADEAGSDDDLVVERARVVG